MSSNEPVRLLYSFATQPHSFTVNVGSEKLLTIRPDGRVEADTLENASEAGRVFVESVRHHLHRTLSQADGRREGWQPIAEADRSVPLIVGCWVHTDDEPSWWSAWAVFPGDPLGEDRTWGDEPTHAMPLPAAPALTEGHQEKRDG